MQVHQTTWNKLNNSLPSLSSRSFCQFFGKLIFPFKTNSHAIYRNHNLGLMIHRAGSFSHEPAQYTQPSWSALHMWQHIHRLGLKCLFADRWQQKATFWQSISLCNPMHLGTMRSYSFSTLLTRCDVLRNLSHWIYYCKSRSSACKNPVCSQTALQETSGNIRTACLITPQLLEGMPRPTASAFAQNSAKVHKAALAWDLQG